MQFFALKLEMLISALQAKKHQDYQCPECKEPVRLRSGSQRQPHFYHYKKNSHCRQSQKSLEHLHTQLRLQSLLAEECAMEHPFPTISRIADLFWKKEGIVFEIQCSPISKEEIEARSKDYRSLGLEIVWILHEKNFNRKYLTAAERFLEHQPHYFTNIDKNGKGEFFDQFSILQGFKRRFKGPKLSINLSQPYPITSIAISRQLPNALKIRIENWSIGFHQDLCYQSLKEGKSLNNLIWLENRYKQVFEAKIAWKFLIQRAYAITLEKLIKKASK